ITVLNASEDTRNTIPGITDSGFLRAGEWQIWADIAGHWFYLTGLNPDLNRKLLHARAYVEDPSRPGGVRPADPIAVGAPADVYLDDGQPLRLFTYGYDADDFEWFFGSVYRNRYDLGTEMVKQVLDRGGTFDTGNTDNDSLG